MLNCATAGSAAPAVFLVTDMNRFLTLPPALRRGEAVDIRITLGDTRPALTAPNGAWLEGSGGAYAFVMNRNGRRAERRAISVGRRNPSLTEAA